MRNLKKLLVVFVLILSVIGLTGCTSMNKVVNYFEDQGYNYYEYSGVGDSLIFALHDDLGVEETERLGLNVVVTDSTETTTTEDDDDDEDDYKNSLLSFTSYVFSNNENYVVVMEFDSEEYLLEVLEVSTVLSEFYEGYDQADYVNGNCLLVYSDEYIDLFDYFVEVFQGEADPLEVVETTTTTTTTASTDE